MVNRTVTPDPRIIVALDYADAETAMTLARRLEPGQCRLKVGKELFTRAGPDMVRRLVDRGFDVFLDLKFHDIPNTVARACRAGAEMGAWMINVHALGGPRMLEAAREAVGQVSGQRPLLIAVTILTSMDEHELRSVGLQDGPEENVLRLAGLAGRCGLDGVVCSPLEVAPLRTQHGPDFMLVTPGIRPAGEARDDQRRTLSAVEAIRAGADYLVIGRPVTRADDPLQALLTINSEIGVLNA
jgi:orotidine-5'-phosphate decarboxylase